MAGRFMLVEASILGAEHGRAGDARRGGGVMVGDMWKAQSGGGDIPGRASPFTACGKDRLAWPSRLIV